MTYLAEQLADGVLGAYLLAGAAGSSTMADSSGNARDGTHTNVDLGATPGLIDTGTCARYNGVDGFSSVTSAAWMNVTNITIEAAFRPSVNNTILQMLARDSNTAALRTFQFRMNASGQLEFLFWDAAGTLRTVTGATALSRYTQYHGAATYDGTTARVYVNGVQDGSLSLTSTLRVPAGSVSLRVGNSERAGTSFSGTVAGVGYYGSALSAARLLVHSAAAAASGTTWDGSGTWGIVS